MVKMVNFMLCAFLKPQLKKRVELDQKSEVFRLTKDIFCTPNKL